MSTFDARVLLIQYLWPRSGLTMISLCFGFGIIISKEHGLAVVWVSAGLPHKITLARVRFFILSFRRSSCHSKPSHRSCCCFFCIIVLFHFASLVQNCLQLCETIIIRHISKSPAIYLSISSRIFAQISACGKRQASRVLLKESTAK